MTNKLSANLKEPYHIINSCFAGIILMIFLYSGIFSASQNNYPIKSACEVLTGKPCSSTGLSRGFSEIVRFNFKSALNYNSQSVRVFLFFLIQLILRFASSLVLIKNAVKQNQVITIDSIVSVGSYVYCFWNIIT